MEQPMKTMNKRSLCLSLVPALGAALSAPAVQAADAKPARATVGNQAAANKALVLKAYQELFGDHDLTALDRYWAKDYIQHNLAMGDGTEAVKQFIEKLGIFNGPKGKVEFLRVAADGDLVFLRLRQPATPYSPETVIVDIFRVANGKIAEHWDVIQAVPAERVNKRPMY
jgi:predicted SnoaL-like aldol condensation-catalyzing enzyme